MRFALFMPPRASSAGLPMLMFLAGSDVHRGNIHDKGRCAANGRRNSASRCWCRIQARAAQEYRVRPMRGTSASAPVSIWTRRASLGPSHWRMESYLMRELLAARGREVFDRCVAHRYLRAFDGRSRCVDACVAAPDRFASVSAFAPIAAPMQAPWGKKAFSGYLGEDVGRWEQHDASALMSRQTGAAVSAWSADRSGAG